MAKKPPAKGKSRPKNQSLTRPARPRERDPVEHSVKNPQQIGANTNSSADLLEQETLEDVSGTKSDGELADHVEDQSEAQAGDQSPMALEEGPRPSPTEQGFSPIQRKPGHPPVFRREDGVAYLPKPPLFRYVSPGGDSRGFFRHWADGCDKGAAGPGSPLDSRSLMNRPLQGFGRAPLNRPGSGRLDVPTRC